MCFLFLQVPRANYQNLSDNYSAVEPPTWALLLAESCRSKGFKVGLMDMNAEKISYKDAFSRINNLKPRLICFVAYGQNVNAGTTNMAAVSEFANYLKNEGFNNLISVVGSHVQALPLETLNKEPQIDFVFTNEGVYSIHNILKEKIIDINSIKNIKGIAYRKNGIPIINPSKR